jgi:CheY-like chemotaxis protein
MYAEFLGAEGIQVIQARNGMEGFTRACESGLDAIVTDLRLPNLDGWELIRQLRADPRTTEIPIVIVSGFGTHADREQARRLGCDIFLTKPCAATTLTNAVQKVLE